ncbi:MAG: hypothetical protein K0S32_2896 [Bacteroidetes bacterium]|nr:hypothetical protein [Bacteroidota bacterium]
MKGFKLLGTTKFFREKENKECALLFAPTNLGNYYLMHKWGKELKWYRAITSWPLKNFETLFLTVIMVTAIITLCIPNYHLVLAREIDYWSTYRIGIFFHILIFNMGATAYYTFAFGKNLSVSLWNNNRDF